MNLNALSKQLDGGKPDGKAKVSSRSAAFRAFVKAVKADKLDEAEAHFATYLDDDNDDSAED